MTAKRFVLGMVLSAVLSIGWLAGAIYHERSVSAQQQLVGATVIPQPVVTIPYSAAMATDAFTGTFFQITATNGTAFTINSPTGGYSGEVISYRVRNTSGGVLGAVTFGAAFKLGAAWASPATTFSRTIQFEFDGTNWVEVNRAAADISN